MCLDPIFVSKPQARESFIRRLYDAKLTDKLRTQVAKTKFSAIQVPCGKCSDCLRQKQNDLATRVVRQAKRDGNFVFVTLTFKEESLPVACSTQFVDKNTGEMINSERPLISKNMVYQQKVVDKPIGKNPRYVDELYEDFDKDYALNIRFTPSLDRKKFRLYLKRKRLEFERKGNSLPEFKYVCVGEYGPKTCRPHFHICMTGIDKKTTEDLFSEWNDNFGDVQVKQVKMVNSDGSYGYAIAAKYVGKYMCKGKFECPSVIQGFAEKPRICISNDFGTYLSEQDIAYYMAFDLYGIYNPNDLSHFAEYQVLNLISEISKRARVDVFGFKYSLPKNMKRKLFYEKVQNEKDEVRYEPTQIQALRNYLLQKFYLDSLLEDLRTAGFEVPEESISKAFAQFKSSQKVAAQFKRIRQERDLSSFYGQSNF